jgi:L-aspartate oxidase
MSGVPVVSRRLADAPEHSTRDVDVVVVGTGAGGMSAALRAAQSGLRVLVVTKGELGEGATAWAQGGLAAALAPTDSLAAHVEDTLSAGPGCASGEWWRRW